MVTFSPDVKYSYAQIRAPGSNFTWALLVYNGDKIIAIDIGVDFPDLGSMFQDHQVQYAYLRINDKYILIRWIGGKVNSFKRGQASLDVKQLKTIVSEFQLEIITSDRSDLSREKIIDRLH